MKFYILGASGFLGSQAVKYFKEKGHEVLTERIDVRDFAALKNKFQETKPDVVINMTGGRAVPHIDWCEDHKLETTAVNVVGALNAMMAAIEVGAYPIEIGSGCVYEGGTDREFTEEDEPNFTGSYYSRQRIALQHAMKELPVLYARIRMPMTMFPHPRNFITKISRYKEMISIPNGMTLLEDMLPALEKLTVSKPVGILNFCNEGYVTHGQIMKAYKEIVDPNHTYIPISLERLVGPGGITKAGRSNCVLNIDKAKSFGLSFPPLDDVRLIEIMKVYKKNLDAIGGKIE